jgi:hypothetical protein
MPGPIVHLIVQQRLADRLIRNAKAINLPPDLGNQLAADRCSPYAGSGSGGPDFLFFSMREYAPLLEILRTSSSRPTTRLNHSSSSTRKMPNQSWTRSNP